MKHSASTAASVDTTGPGRAAWIETRKTGLGASDVAAILGMSPWSSPYSVWAEKVEGWEQEPNEAMLWGKRLEGVIRDQFADETDLVAGPEMMVFHPEHKIVFATIDGYVSDAGGDPIGVLELKTDGSYGRWQEVPDHYQLQVQWQLLATQLDMAWVACLHGGRNFQVYEVPADPTVQSMVLERAEAWWEKHVTGGVPPEVDGASPTTRVLADLYPDSTPGAVDLDDKSYAAVATLRTLKARAKELEAEIARWENTLKAVLGDYGTGEYQGREVVRWRTVERKGYEVKPSKFRRFELVKEKE